MNSVFAVLEQAIQGSSLALLASAFTFMLGGYVVGPLINRYPDIVDSRTRRMVALREQDRFDRASA
jgi:hypothetical protein